MLYKNFDLFSKNESRVSACARIPFPFFIYADNCICRTGMRHDVLSAMGISKLLFCVLTSCGPVGRGLVREVEKIS
jgi:hypothetical protein